MAEFGPAWDFTHKWEGGYSNDPRDPGGETWCGISRGYHPDWPGWPLIDQVRKAYGKSVWVPEMWSRTGPQVEGFYRETFWGDLADLPSQVVATVMFDTSVNCGNGRAGRWLQQALCAWGYSVKVDGIVGPNTMAELLNFLSRNTQSGNRNGDTRLFVDSLLSLRVAHYVALNKRTFTRGWHRRVAALRELTD